MGIAYNTSIVRDGLVLHLDASNVKSYPGTGTVWKDLSMSGNDMSASWSYNTAEKAMDVSAISSTLTLNSTVSKHNFTYCYWFRPYAAPLGDWRMIARFYDTNNITYFQIDTRQATNPSVLHYVKDYTINSWDTYALYNNTEYNNYNWHYGVLSMGSSTQWKTYLDGSLLGTTAVTKDLTPYTDIAKIQISSPSVYLSNSVLYNRELSAAEIRQNFEALRGRYGI